MYKVEGSVLTSESEILTNVDVTEFNIGGVFNQTTTDEDGKFSMYVSSPSTDVHIGKIGYKTQVVKASELNNFGISYLDEAIVVRTNKKNNNLMLIFIAAGIITTGVVIYNYKRAKPIKIK